MGQACVKICVPRLAKQGLRGPKDEMIVAALGWGAELLRPRVGGRVLTLPVHFHGFGNLT